MTATLGPRDNESEDGSEYESGNGSLCSDTSIQGDFYPIDDDSQSEGLIDIDLEEEDMPVVNMRKRSMAVEELEMDASKHKKKKMLSSLHTLEAKTLEDIALSLLS